MTRSRAAHVLVVVLASSAVLLAGQAAAARSKPDDAVTSPALALLPNAAGIYPRPPAAGIDDSLSGDAKTSTDQPINGASTIPALAALVPADLGPLVSGTEAYVDGVHTWTDYVYDDLSSGYRDGERNAADLVQLQIALDDGGVAATAVLETLTDSDAPVVTVQFDVDDDGDAEHTLSGGIVDPASNTVRLHLPVDPEREVWRVTASVATTDGVVHDLAYVGGEAPEGWQDARQGSVLAGTAPLPWGAIDFGLVRDGVTEVPDLRTPGWHTLLYRSDLELGEGIGQATITTAGGTTVPVGDLYAGPYQPYLAWVPEGLPERPPLVVHMHGFAGSHTSTYGLLGPGLVDPAAVVVSPLGRGGTTFYMGAAEQDVLDVIDDALVRFDADADRVVVSGTSMGGFGAFRLAVRYPDRFSVALPLIGTGASAHSAFPFLPAPGRDEVFRPDAFPGGQGELLANLSNLPLRAVNGQVDPIVNNVLSTEDLAFLTSLGSDHRFWVLLRRHHEVVPALTACLFDEAVATTRVVAPARVRYVVEPATWIDDPSTGLRLRYDAAYWVSGLVAAGELGALDATTLAIADRSPTTERIDRAGQNLTVGADLCGPNPAVRTDDAWREHGVVRRAGPPQDTANALSLSLSGLTVATVDLPGARLMASAPLVVDVQSDGDSFVRLRGPWIGPVTVAVDGEPAGTLVPDDGVVTLPVGTGQHIWSVIP